MVNLCLNKWLKIALIRVLRRFYHVLRTYTGILNVYNVTLRKYKAI